MAPVPSVPLVPPVRRMLLAAAVGLFLVACGGAREPAALPNRPLTIGTSPEPTNLVVEVADTPQARSRGLMGRASLGPDEGMAFLFDGPTRGAFWMKDTTIPLSIAFWDGRGRIVAILDMDPCLADPCPTYEPGEPFVGAVEVNQGFFEEHGVEVGDTVELG